MSCSLACLSLISRLLDFPSKEAASLPPRLSVELYGDFFMLMPSYIILSSWSIVFQGAHQYVNTHPITSRRHQPMRVSHHARRDFTANFYPSRMAPAAYRTQSNAPQLVRLWSVTLSNAEDFYNLLEKSSKQATASAAHIYNVKQRCGVASRKGRLIL